MGMSKKCPKCGVKMERFGLPTDKQNWMDECTKCDYTFCSAVMKRSLLKSDRDCREGRTYIWSCATKRGKCQKSGGIPRVCHSCSTEQAKRWYELGRKDERKKFRRGDKNEQEPL